MGSIPTSGDKEQARQAWARTVKHLRYGRGWSQPQLAAALIAADAPLRRLARDREHVRRRLADFEGAHRLPSEDYAIAFICTFASLEELAGGTIRDGSELDVLLTAFARMGVPVDRRRFLLNAAATALAGASTFRDWQPVPTGLDDPERIAWVLAHPRHADPTTVRLMQAEVLGLLRQSEARPPGELFPQAQRWLERAAVLRSHAAREPVLAEAATLEALAALLAGKAVQGLVWDPELAGGYYQRALDAGQHDRQAPGWLAALSAAHLASLVLNRSGSPREAGRLTEQALAALDGRSPSAAAWARALHAEACAAQGRQHEAEAALDAAGGYASTALEADPLAGMFPPERLRAFEGVVWLWLEQPAKATAPLEAFAATFDAAMPRPRAAALADLAYALACQGEVERACATIGAALTLLACTRDAGGLSRVRRGVRELSRLAPTEPCVQEARDRLLELQHPRRK